MLTDPFADDVCALAPDAPEIPPTAVVIFGASGDLTQRKIIPAFYHLQLGGRLPEGFAIVGFARRPKTDEQFRKELRTALELFSHTKPVDEPAWDALARHIHYHQADIGDRQGYLDLAQRLRELPEHDRFKNNHLFYLATAPEHFATVADLLTQAGLSPSIDPRGAHRLIVEKPFGSDRDSAHRLNTALHCNFGERNVFRIDHYLGKETVQNLLYFRFGNAIYEPLWNRSYIDHVQITVAEQVGVGDRGGYYEKAGAARDMLQNHLFQLLTLVAMEPPASLDAESIRDEKVKVLRSLPAPAELLRQSVRAQYGPGTINGREVRGYRQEPRVAVDSRTETYVAARLEIDNWRWSGVPFYLRTGKALGRACTEISIVFKRPPSVLFAAVCGVKLRRNVLRIRIQPDEGIHLNFNAKVPGQPKIQEVDMNFFYREDFRAYLPEAYERLLVDALAGDATLFTRHDEVDQAWRIVDRLRAVWAEREADELPQYPAGSMGPREAEELLAAEGRSWLKMGDD